MVEAKLTYFPSRGRAETLRMLMCVGGIQFEEIFLETREQFLQLCKNGALAFDQVPLVEIDGLQLVQTRATARYLAQRAGMLGKTPAEAARIDILFEGTRDFYQPYMMYRPASHEKFLEEYHKKHKPKYMVKYEKFLGDTGTGYLVGDLPSLADVGLMEVLQSLEEYLGLSVMDEFPNIKKFYNKMREHPGIKVYREKYKKPSNIVQEKVPGYEQKVKVILGLTEFN